MSFWIKFLSLLLCVACNDSIVCFVTNHMLQESLGLFHHPFKSILLFAIVNKITAFISRLFLWFESFFATSFRRYETFLVTFDALSIVLYKFFHLLTVYSFNGHVVWINGINSVFQFLTNILEFLTLGIVTSIVTCEKWKPVLFDCFQNFIGLNNLYLFGLTFLTIAFTFL